MGTAEEREQELNELLARCRQEYRGLVELVGNPTSVDPASLAEHQKRELSSTLGSLLWDLDRVESLLGDAALEGLPQSIAPQELEFHRLTLRPARPHLESLFEGVDFSRGFFLSLPRPEAPITPVWRIFWYGYYIWRDSWDDDPDKVEPSCLGSAEVDDAARLLHSPFFDPDQWLRNLKELEPVLGDRAAMRVPSNIRVRLRELYQSFVLGNFFATIALARAVLEYSLMDRVKTLGIDVSAGDPIHPTWTKRLSQLVDEVSEVRPDLRLAMESIVDAGNKTLHPKKKDGLATIPSALRQIALGSTQDVRTVIEELYLRSS